MGSRKSKKEQKGESTFLGIFFLFLIGIGMGVYAIGYVTYVSIMFGAGLIIGEVKSKKKPNNK